MLRLWSARLLGLCVGLVLGALGCAHHEEKHETKPAVLKATIHKDGKEEDHKLDMSKKEDIEKLRGHLDRHEVEHLAKEKDINLLAIRWELALWTVVVFVLLCLILRKAAWGPMLEGLQKREQNILSAIEDAQKARDEAQKLRAELQRELDKAYEKVRDILDEARRDAQHATEEMVAKARAEIQSERDRLRREIETAKDQAIQQLWNQAARLATEVSSKVIPRQLNSDDHRRLVDETLAELGKMSGNGR